jgi:NTP pyrophosphatase (non-canonical NTP hydrolase)
MFGVCHFDLNLPLKKLLLFKTMSQFGLSDIQSRVLAVYRIVNEWKPLWFLQNFLTARATSLLATVEKRQIEHVKVQLVQTLSWACSLANHRSVELRLHAILRKHYPGVCPYCGYAPCKCKAAGRAEERLPAETLDAFERALPADTNLQDMMKSIYPENEFRASVDHLVAEVGELAQENNHPFLLSWCPHVGPDYELELADVIAHLFGLSNLISGYCLIDAATAYFENGCPVCHKEVCRCDMGKVQLQKVRSRPQENEAAN